MAATARDITVVGAGIFGLWQSLTLARAGHRVRLIERSSDPFGSSSSRLAGAMLCPDCEAESAPALVRDQGHRGLALWRDVYPGLVQRGSLLVAHARDRTELSRFERVTHNHQNVDVNALAKLEPDLAGRFTAGLYYPDEAHMVTPDAMKFLLETVVQAGAVVELETEWQNHDQTGDLVIDCRGFAAREALPDLRGVRGERLIIRTPDVILSRPVRLLHPRFPLYVVPWTGGRFLVGATLIESEDQGPMTVRSALELLGMVYALHPAFAEAEIVEMAAGLRPAFADNVPRARVRDEGRLIVVNGAWRHGFLLAPILAEAVAAFVANPNAQHPLLQQGQV